MGRYYRLSKKITDDMATAILNEINELENVQTARITEDNKYLFLSLVKGPGKRVEHAFPIRYE